MATNVFWASESPAQATYSPLRYPLVGMAVGAVLVLALMVGSCVVGGGKDAGDNAASTDAPDQRVDVIRAAPGFAISPEEQVLFSATSTLSIAAISLPDGAYRGTTSAVAQRPALSLAKLYIAQYVVEHGDPADEDDAMAMIRSSSDVLADRLYAKYPDAIDLVAREYELTTTQANPRWGYSLTSMYDVARFVAKLATEDPSQPVLRAMSEALPTAEDGYRQSFGTAVLPGVVGTKFAWTDKRDAHAAVSYGEDFVVAAYSVGDADRLTDLVGAQLGAN